MPPETNPDRFASHSTEGEAETLDAEAVTVVTVVSLDDLHATQIRTEQKVDQLIESIGAILTIAQTVGEQAQPMLDGLSKNPMLKALFR